MAAFECHNFDLKIVEIECTSVHYDYDYIWLKSTNGNLSHSMRTFKTLSMIEIYKPPQRLRDLFSVNFKNSRN